MCDRAAQLGLWRAGYDAGRMQQATIDRAALLEGAAAYQGLLLRQVISVLAGMLGEHQAARRGPGYGAGRRAAGEGPPDPAALSPALRRTA
jgi:hypothetical protein